jgi:hypothetical protein
LTGTTKIDSRFRQNLVDNYWEFESTQKIRRKTSSPKRAKTRKIANDNDSSRANLNGSSTIGLSIAPVSFVLKKDRKKDPSSLSLDYDEKFFGRPTSFNK